MMTTSMTAPMTKSPERPVVVGGRAVGSVVGIVVGNMVGDTVGGGVTSASENLVVATASVTVSPLIVTR